MKFLWLEKKKQKEKKNLNQVRGKFVLPEIPILFF